MNPVAEDPAAGRPVINGRMWELAIPLRAPFSNATGTVAERRVVIVSVTDGMFAGWGEAAPYPGITPDTVDDAWASLERGSVLAPSAAAAIDEAMGDLMARRDGTPLWQSLGGSHRSIATSIAVGLDEDPVRRVEETGAAAVKLKIRPRDDVSRVAALRAALPQLPVGVDANGSYRWEDRRSLLELDGYGVAYIEQPFASGDLASHARLREEMVASVALDEPIDSTSMAIKAVEAGAADILVVKPSRLGLTAARAIHDIALAAGLRIKASGLVETAIGRAHTLAIATLPAAVYSDVAAPSWYLDGAVERDGSEGTRGCVDLSDLPGIGFEPDPEVFARYVVREAVLGSRIWD